MLFVKVFDNFDLQRSSPKSSISCSQFTDNIDNNPSNIPLIHNLTCSIFYGNGTMNQRDEPEWRDRSTVSFSRKLVRSGLLRQVPPRIRNRVCIPWPDARWRAFLFAEYAIHVEARKSEPPTFFRIARGKRKGGLA